MKKTIIIAAALVFTTGILASQSQTKVTTTTSVQALTAPKVVIADRKELASGDKIKMNIHDLSYALQIDVKSESFIRLWEQMETPFESPHQAQFFLEKIKSSLQRTMKMTAQVQENLEKIKKLAE